MTACGYLYVAGSLSADHAELDQRRSGLNQLSRDRALDCACACAANLLASSSRTLGSLRPIDQLLKLKLALPEGLSKESCSAIRWGASELIGELLGPDRSAHGQTVLTVAILPVGVVVEAAAIMRIRAEAIP